MTNNQKGYILRCINKDITQQEKAIEDGEYDSVKQIREAIANIDQSIAFSCGGR